MSSLSVLPDEGSRPAGGAAPAGPLRDRLARLGEAVFPEPPRSELGLRGRLLARAATALIALLAVPVVALRLPVERWDALWAEDGSIFLYEGLNEPVWQAFSTPYAGYLHAYPRLSTLLVTALPVAAAGVAYTLLAAVAVVWVAWTVWSCSAGLLTSPWLRAVLAAAVLLIPAGGLEAVANVSNSHFFLAFGAFWALLGRPWSLPAELSAHALVLVATLTDPICAGLFPLALLRLVCLRGLRERSVALTYAAGTVVQLLVVLSTERPTGAPPSWMDIVFGYGLRVVSPSFLGFSNTQALVDDTGAGFVKYVAAAVGLLLVAGLLVARRLGLALVAAAVASVAFWVATTVASLNGGYPPRGDSHLVLDAASRYTIIPSLLLLSAWALAAQGVLRRIGRWAGALVVVLAAAPVVAFGVTDFRPDHEVRPDLPPWSDVVEQAAESCGSSPAVQPPPGVIAPGGAWRVHLSCRDLD